MPIIIPTQPAVPHYRLTSPIDGETYHFDFRWNARDSAWYFDVYAEDDSVIALGLKVVMGTYPGRHINHRLFRSGVFFVVDRERAGNPPTLLDFGQRAVLVRYTVPELWGSSGLAP